MLELLESLLCCLTPHFFFLVFPPFFPSGCNKAVLFNLRVSSLTEPGRYKHSPRPRQRFRPCTRQDMLKKMRAVAAMLMVLSVVTATVVQGFVLANPNLRILSIYMLFVVLLVSAALRSVLVTNSLPPTYNRSLDTTAVYDTYL